MGRAAVALCRTVLGYESRVRFAACRRRLPITRTARSICELCPVLEVVKTLQMLASECWRNQRDCSTQDSDAVALKGPSLGAACLRLLSAYGAKFTSERSSIHESVPFSCIGARNYKSYGQFRHNFWDGYFSCLSALLSRVVQLLKRSLFFFGNGPMGSQYTSRLASSMASRASLQRAVPHVA